jgi:hypothetical protein
MPLSNPFWKKFIPGCVLEAETGVSGNESMRNCEALQRCLKDPFAKGTFLWFSTKLKLNGHVNDCKAKDCEILAKSAQFLEDGHVIFCLANHAERLADLERKEEKTLMAALKKCVKSHVGYVGEPGSPRVESLGEFMVQLEERKKSGHWLFRMGMHEGEEMTAGQFLREAWHERWERCGERAEDMSVGHAATGVATRINRHDEFHFHFNDKTETGRVEHKHF